MRTKPAPFSVRLFFSSFFFAMASCPSTFSPPPNRSSSLSPLCRQRRSANSSRTRRTWTTPTLRAILCHRNLPKGQLLCPSRSTLPRKGTRFLVKACAFQVRAHEPVCPGMPSRLPSLSFFPPPTHTLVLFTAQVCRSRNAVACAWHLYRSAYGLQPVGPVQVRPSKSTSLGRPFLPLLTSAPLSFHLGQNLRPRCPLCKARRVSLMSIRFGRP